ncbi:MAG: hypothetical protein ACYCYN_11325, partial [Solirubrobacteraceae bacterium]
AAAARRWAGARQRWVLAALAATVEEAPTAAAPPAPAPAAPDGTGTGEHVPSRLTPAQQAEIEFGVG